MYAPGRDDLLGDEAGGGECEGFRPLHPCPSADCSGRGRCRNGVCDCVAGVRGDACELPPPPAVLARRPAPRPRIFVYTLPPGLAAYRKPEMLDRNTGWLLWRALLVSPHREYDPAGADYFFVPVFPMLGTTDHDLLTALEYIRLSLPYWDRTDGHNHIVVAAWDGAFCNILGLPVFSRLTVIGHFGLTNMTAWCPCCLASSPAVGPVRPGVDLLVPDVMELPSKRRRPAGGVPRGAPRRVNAFFGGGPSNKWRAYALANFNATPGWRVGGHVDLPQAMSSAVFCIDLSASGFSTRFALALFFGCIPIYSDIVEPPWQWVLPIPEFAIRFDVHRLHELPSIVDAVPQAEVERLQEGGRKYWCGLLGSRRVFAQWDAGLTPPQAILLLAYTVWSAAGGGERHERGCIRTHDAHACREARDMRRPKNGGHS